jgi:sec-independent protein translocase protein TatB
MFDFGVGYSELFVLGLIAILVIGPKDLPKVMRMIGQTTKKLRGMAREFQGHVDAAMKDSGMDELKKDLNSTKETIDKVAKDAPKTSIPMPSLQPPNDFKTVFGADAPAGETRVAGHLVQHAEKAAT